MVLRKIDYMSNGEKFRIETAQGTVEECYRRATAASEDFPFLVNVFNHIPDIKNQYESFNEKRAKIYQEAGIVQLPSACAIDVLEDEFFITYVRSNIEPIVHQNPKQTPPDMYPDQYGKPRFSRAANIGRSYFLSGTASIKGSKTIHPYNLWDQAMTLASNLKALNIKEKLIYYCYVRNEADKTLAAEALAKNNIDVVSIKTATLCRDDLMIEIEGLPLWMERK